VPKPRNNSDQAPKPPAEGEHIFPASEITPLALKWKELNASGRHTQAMLVLDEIILKSTPMFERFAQHEEYTNTVELSILVSAAQEKVIKWLLKWEPKLGKIFSWFSKCAKHAFLSEIVKANQYKKRYHVTGDNLEKYYGTIDHESDRHDMSVEFDRSLKDLFCRWGSPQEIGAIRYMVECLVHDLDNHNKQAAIRGAAYAWGISMDMAKFFYGWVLIALRDLHYAKVRVPFTEEDLLRHALTYTNFVELYQFMSHDQIKKLIAVMGGQRIKIPTIAQIARLKDDYDTFEAVLDSDKDPATVADIAKKKKRSPRTAADAYQSMIEATNPNRSGEYSVYDGDNESNS
jgi:hypothetical protein